MLLQRRLCPWGSLTKSGPQGVTYVQTSYKTCWGGGRECVQTSGPGLGLEDSTQSRLGRHAGRRGA